MSCLKKNIKRVFSFFGIFFLSINTFSQVVINEVMPRPSGGDSDGCIQSMVNTTDLSCGAEWIELYNPDPCQAADVSCYFIGSRTWSGNTNTGVFSIPNGTTIPPLGFLTIGGAQSGADILIPANAGRFCSGTTRWYLENLNGWVALYASNGNPVDAVFWTGNANAANTLTTNADFSYQPNCIPTNSCGSASGSFLGARDIPGVSYAGQRPNAGQTIKRTADGATTWSTNNTPTLGNCNANCVTNSNFIVPATIIQPVCGNNNGSISINPQPSGAYTYVWNPNVSNTNSASNLGAGNYVISISLNGCQRDTTITLTSTGSGPSAIVVNVTNSSCGTSNGQVSLGNVTGGTGPYQYNFNGQGFSNSTQYTNLAAGNFTLIVKDANGCTYSAPNITISNTNGPTAIAVTVTDASCGGTDGQVSLGNVTGGTGPYQYNLNGQGISNSTQYTNLAAGNYTLVVEDANGCTYSAPNITISNTNGPTAIVVTVTDASCGGTDGQVSLGNVTGGTGPYQYNFNGQGLSNSTQYTNLAAGNYTLVVEDANGCTYSAPNITISNTNGPTAIVVTVTDASCGGTDGQVSLGNVTGGSAPYQYNFNGQGLSNSTQYTNLAAGNYTLVVEDANGCSFSAPDITIGNSNGPSEISVNPIDASCGQNNGAVSLGNVTGGSAPYQYNFNGQGLSNSTQYTNLAAGNYTLVVEDANGCSFSAPDITIGNSNGPSEISVNITDASCGQNNGAVSLGNVTGGSAPYQYNFNGQGLSNSTQYTNLAAGNYTLVVEDANGCSFSAPDITIGNSNGPSAISVNPTDASCGQDNGAVSLGNVTGGSAPYQYNFNGQGLSNSTQYTNLAEGNYTLVVEDANGCSYSAPDISISSAVGIESISLLTTGVTCEGADGTLTITGTQGGIAPFSYRLDNNAPSTETFYSGLSSGLHSIAAFDGSGCSIDTSITIASDDEPQTIYYPNSFTPNGGNLNDFWEIKGNCIKGIVCRIFNRWGQQISYAEIINDGTDIFKIWDGKIGNIDSELGVYSFSATINFDSGKQAVRYGHIVLVR